MKIKSIKLLSSPSFSLEEKEEVLEEKEEEILQKESEDIDEVAEPTTKESEDSHGGDEATKDIEDSDNPADEGQQEQDSDQSSGSGEENEDPSDGNSSENDSQESGEEPVDSSGSSSNSDENSNEEESENEDSEESKEESSSEGPQEGEDSEESESGKESSSEGHKEENTDSDESENEDSQSEGSQEGEESENWKGSKNHNQAFDVLAQKYRKQKLSNSLLRIISRLSEDLTSDKLDGFEEWDVQALMKRSYTKSSLQSCKYMREKEKIIIMVDTSGSCQSFAELFSSIAQITGNFGMCEIYLCPNASPQNVWDPKTKDYRSIYKNDILESFKNRTILFFGDFDGAWIICNLSQTNQVYWFSNECERNWNDNGGYDDFYDHDWNGNYSFADFRGEYIPIHDETDLVYRLHQFRFKQVFSSPAENKRRHIKELRR